MYVESDKLLLDDVFNNLDPAHFLSSAGLVWQTALKKTKVKLDLWTNIGMLLMVEIGIRVGVYHAIHQYAKANNKYMQDYDKKKELLRTIKCWDVKKLYCWAIS